MSQAGRAPSSTYRLQISARFTLDDAAGQVGYLARLGVGALYLSPLLPSARGSDHGYDVVGYDTVDAPRGGPAAWQRLLAAAREHGLGVVVDIVPNHTGVADASQNPAWWSLLRLGRDSPYADWFDVDWSRGKILLPVLGDPDDGGDALRHLRVEGGELRYFEHRFPLAPGTASTTGGGPDAQTVHARQHYELVNFRRADTEQNYRRFFAVVSLAGLRVELPAVFDATHAEIARWAAEPGVVGLRVDHPDGLADPLQYLRRLRGLAGEDAWITVEKILETGEPLPADWPVAGTTGYESLAAVTGLLLDPDAEAAMTSLYQRLTADRVDFPTQVAAGKRQTVETILRAEVSRLARLFGDEPLAGAALAELLVAFEVYRSYLPAGVEHLYAAAARVLQRRPELGEVLERLVPVLADPGTEAAIRFQQTSGAVMAKGVEDTGFYRYNRLVALNEVGGDPGTFGLPAADFHAAAERAHAGWPARMTTLSTHDTKRGEDVRARLLVLAEVPEAWAQLVEQLLALAPLPDAGFAYLLWQTFAGTGFIERERMHAYAEKAMREAARSTTWIDPDEAFEQAVHAAVDAGYDDPPLREPLQRFLDATAAAARSNSLTQKLVQLTMPGVPDVYQGSEVAETSLVDPDNRRPVDFDAHARLLARLDADGVAPPLEDAGAAKLWVSSRALRLRRDRPELFAGYRALSARGPAQRHLVAFDRGGAITLATRLPIALARGGGWRDTTLHLPPGHYVNVLDGRTHGGTVAVQDVLGSYPVGLLSRTADELSSDARTAPGSRPTG